MNEYEGNLVYCFGYLHFSVLECFSYAYGSSVYESESCVILWRSDDMLDTLHIADGTAKFHRFL